MNDTDDTPPYGERLHLIERLHRQLLDAQQTLNRQLADEVESILGRPGATGDDVKALMTHLYDSAAGFPTETLAAIFGVRAVDLTNIVGGRPVEMICPTCGKSHRRKVRGRKRSPVGICVECQAQNAKARDDRWRAEAEAAAESDRRKGLRLLELRKMPYREYLATPEWDAMRRRKLKQAWFRCQACNASGVRLDVHHRTYERRGEERMSDLIVLCAACHETFHAERNLAD